MKISSFISIFVCFLSIAIPLSFIGVPYPGKTPSNRGLSPVLGDGYGKQSLFPKMESNSDVATLRGDKR